MDLQRELVLNNLSFHSKTGGLHLIVQHSVYCDCERSWRNMYFKAFSKCSEGTFALVARNNFTACKKHVLRWRGPISAMKPFSYYFFQVKDLITGMLVDGHESSVEFHYVSLLLTKQIAIHLFAYEKYIPGQRLSILVDCRATLMEKLAGGVCQNLNTFWSPFKGSTKTIF